MRPRAHCEAVIDGEVCGMVKNGSAHLGSGWTHDYEGPKKEKFGERRADLNVRSAERETLMREVIRPRVREARATGKRCQIQSPFCTGLVQGVHEAFPSGRAGGRAAALRDGPSFLACNACNGYVSGDGQAWAKERGFLFSNTVTDRERAAQARDASPPPARRSKFGPR